MLDGPSLFYTIGLECYQPCGSGNVRAIAAIHRPGYNQGNNIFPSEVLAHLVVAAVFKTVGP